MKFDYVIGNPPYQEETDSDSTRMPPVYNLFMDESYKVAHKVELITPARFLFNAGYTPKSWNEKILNDEHFKVCYTNAEIVNRLLLSTTTHSGGTSTRQKCKELGLDSSKSIEFSFSTEE